MKEKAEINKSLFPFFISYSSNQLVKSSTNYRMWWSRNSQQTSAGLLYGGVTVEECHKMIQKSLQTPKVKFLMEQMEKSGCPIRSNFIKAVRCKHRAGGFFVPGKGIVVCSNYLRFQDEVNQVVIHELIHAYDECRAANLN